MLNEDLHLADQELLLAADGELPAHRAAQVHAHLAACWGCRARMAEIEATIADFARAHRQTLDPQLPPVAGPRALLRARLADLAAERQANSWQRLFQFTTAIFQFTTATRAAAFLCVAAFMAAAVGGLLIQHSTLRMTSPIIALSERAAVPDRSLTPGATRIVTTSDVCSMPHEEVIGEVSASLRQEVFHEYGIANARAGDYEIDYLIAPGLGGTEDIHNLWPQPYTSRTWNAHVKDTLEEHLHQLVCAGKLDLSTAQRDIATDWIAAYKNYFHTDKPLSQHSRLESEIVGLRQRPPRGRRLPDSKLNSFFVLGA
jgi:hypothetical protein